LRKVRFCQINIKQVEFDWQENLRSIFKVPYAERSFGGQKSEDMKIPYFYADFKKANLP
jgi:hypothetical protein